MTLAVRIALGFLLLLLVMVGLAVYHLTVIGQLREEIRSSTHGGNRTRGLIVAIGNDLDRLANATEKAWELAPLEEASGAGSYDELKAKTVLSIDAKLWELLDAVEEQPETLAAVRLVIGRWEVYKSRVDLWLLRHPAGLPLESSPILSRLEEIKEGLGAVETEAGQAIDRKVEDARRRNDEAVLIAKLAASVGLVVAILAAVVVGQSIIRPLRRLTRGTRALAGGDLAFRVQPAGTSELRDLAEDFNAMAERLSQLDQLKKDLVSNVSHDLKAPLASMQETTRLLLEGLAGPLTPKQERLLGMNLRCAERLSRMISDLLDLSRLEAEPSLEGFEEVDLTALVRTAIDELENLVRERGLNVLLSLPTEGFVVAGQAPSLLQVLENLCSNAVKFTPPGGAIGINLRDLATLNQDGFRKLPARVRSLLTLGVLSGCLLEVWDSGPGVPDEHKQRIFERFHRVDPERKGSQGTGLGLAITRTIVERHRGFVWVENRPGGGSSFRVVLWRQAPESLEG